MLPVTCGKGKEEKQEQKKVNKIFKIGHNTDEKRITIQLNNK